MIKAQNNKVKGGGGGGTKHVWIGNISDFPSSISHYQNLNPSTEYEYDSQSIAPWYSREIKSACWKLFRDMSCHLQHFLVRWLEKFLKSLSGKLAMVSVFKLLYQL